MPEEKACVICPDTRSIPETVQDSWHWHGVATQHVEACKVCEQQALTPTTGLEVHPLPAQARKFALRFMAAIMQSVGMSQTEWFQAVALLDTYFLKVSGSIPMLPTTCICMVRLVRKFSNVHPESTNCKNTWLPIARQMARVGVEPQEITEEILNSHEKTICQALDWQIDAMTVAKWVSVFSTRFNLLTNNEYPINTQAARLIAEALIMHESASLQFSHHNVALGVFSIGLVMAHLIPLDLVQPPAISPPSLIADYEQSELNGRLREGVLMDTSLVIGIVEAATCCEFHDLQEAAHSAMHVLLAAERRHLANI